MSSVFKLIVVVLTAVIAYKIHHCFFKVPELPKLEDTWWGPREPSKEDASIKPFKIQIKDEVLKDLQQRLENARPFTTPLEGTKHEYGINTVLLKEITEFWKTKYNWRERERFLNQYPQFTVSVQGLRLHYLHVKSTKSHRLNVLPLLLLHGWPGSVREFYEIIPYLTTPQPGQDFVFEVIIPSLPGYGFSEAAVRPGLGAAQIAVVFKNFMKRLGFEKYYVQGGDWGALIAKHMATLYPDIILGMHANLCLVVTPLAYLKLMLGSIYPSLIIPKEHEHKVYPLSKKYSEYLLESGHLHLKATKPDTVGVALNDSPVGLAAYIIEKFITGTNWSSRFVQDGNLTKKFTYTQLLDNIMIYWVTNSATTSVRLYAESFNKTQMSLGLESIPITVPSACARFPHEIEYTPTSILTEKYANLVQVTDFEDGGHFAAFELPKVLADDIYLGVKKMIESRLEKHK